MNLGYEKYAQAEHPATTRKPDYARLIGPTRATFQERCDVDVSPMLISKIIEAVIDEVIEWQTRLLHATRLTCDKLLAHHIVAE